MSEADVALDKSRELLAEFHNTISEQLNARLSESPKFFTLLVVISTGYAYVLSDHDGHTDTKLFIVATLLMYAAGIWATWYLAALGYSFRFLQHTQHSIECELGWDKFALKSANSDLKDLRGNKSVFWLLPSIYHGHVAGMFGFFGIVSLSFSMYAGTYSSSHRSLIYLVSIAAFLVGVLMVFAFSKIYFNKYCRKVSKSKVLPS